MGFVSLTEDIKQRLIESLSSTLCEIRPTMTQPSIDLVSVREVVQRLMDQALNPILDALTDPNIDLAMEASNARQHNRRLRDQINEEKIMRARAEDERDRLRTEMRKLREINKSLMNAKADLDEIKRAGGLSGQFKILMGSSAKKRR
jgi:hypothetical protein